jgi:signal transduction histidine kinase
VLDRTTTFTVDSALLQELGERLVGAPYVALAELIKNAYDADATKVEVRFESDSIEVVDNGHGMTEDQFCGPWMRVGSPHKRHQAVSPLFSRPLTGSKGIGRLAVQFLGRDLEMTTAAAKETAPEIRALVDWDRAVSAGDLTRAEVAWGAEPTRTSHFAGGAVHGTRLVISRLNQRWEEADVERLAREVWFLQPPVDAFAAGDTDSTEFRVILRSSEDELEKRFSAQMVAFLDQWHARVFGSLVSDSKGDDAALVRLELHFSSGEKLHRTFEIPECAVSNLRFDIRTFYFEGRMKRGLRVGPTREYFNAHGGVYIYDAGFRLPYYGPKNDWLRIEIDHSHRLSRSRLLPDELQVPEGMTYLPTNSRLFGVVRIDTAAERRTAEKELLTQGRVRDYLAIQVTRDRLNENVAYEQLVKIVRQGLDWYAMEEARRRLKVGLQARKAKTEPLPQRLERIEEIVDRHAPSMPPLVARTLATEVKAAMFAAQTDAEVALRKIALLGPLATAGMVALAYEHELGKEYGELARLARKVRSIEAGGAAESASASRVADQLEGWIGRARATRRVFSPLLDAENREVGQRLRARPLLEQLVDIGAPVLPGVDWDLSAVERDLFMPSGSLAEWQSVFHNVWTNAYNAMLDCRRRLVRIRSEKKGKEVALVVEDTGTGLSLANAERLFEPFYRDNKISAERRGLGLGGSGLGLTIVRMVAENRGCRVRFIEPGDGFATAFELSWREAQ